MPTAGNAGAALAAYCARAGIESFVFYPDDAPAITVSEIPLFGGHGFAVNGFTDSNHSPEAGSTHFPPINIWCFFTLTSLLRRRRRFDLPVYR